MNIVRLDHPHNFRYIHLIYLRHHYLSPAVRHFQNYVLQWAKPRRSAEPTAFLLDVMRGPRRKRKRFSFLRADLFCAAPFQIGD